MKASRQRLHREMLVSIIAPHHSVCWRSFQYDHSECMRPPMRDDDS